VQEDTTAQYSHRRAKRAAQFGQETRNGDIYPAGTAALPSRQNPFPLLAPSDLFMSQQHRQPFSYRIISFVNKVSKWIHNLYKQADVLPVGNMKLAESFSEFEFINEKFLNIGVM
jgi:hypothetical protein